MAKNNIANVKAVEFSGVGSIPKLLIEVNGEYETVYLNVGITHLDSVRYDKE
jgi:hypothetical protein|tara:strand:- start:40 stop:195 length:156 start_codon:yes stop_codon:yes gene_type:complete